MLSEYYQKPGQYIDFTHSRKNHSKADFHLHNYFEIYYLIAGDVTFFIEKKMVPLSPGDLLVMNCHEIHKPWIRSPHLYERIVIHFDPAIAQLFSPADFDLLHCYLKRQAGEQNKIPLSQQQREDLFYLLQKMEQIVKNPAQGSEILQLACLVELLVQINRAFRSIPSQAETPNVPENLLAVLDYIERHLSGDLSLKTLAGRFFMNPFHLSRLFKKTIGNTLHEYIVYKRISLAKKLLAEGCNVTDACQQAGFNDYANFIRTFRRTVGMPPGHFKKGLKSETGKGLKRD